MDNTPEFGNRIVGASYCDYSWHEPLGYWVSYVVVGGDMRWGGMMGIYAMSIHRMPGHSTFEFGAYLL